MFGTQSSRDRRKVRNWRRTKIWNVTRDLHVGVQSAQVRKRATDMYKRITIALLTQ